MAQHGQLKKPRKRRVAGGVDTHGDTHHAAVVLLNGARVDAEFPATARGYGQLLSWLRLFRTALGCWGGGYWRLWRRAGPPRHRAGGAGGRGESPRPASTPRQG